MGAVYMYKAHAPPHSSFFFCSAVMGILNAPPAPAAAAAMCDRMNAAAASCCVDAAAVAAVEAAAVGITISARPNVLAPAASASRPSPLSSIPSRREVDGTRHMQQ